VLGPPFTEPWGTDLFDTYSGCVSLQGPCPVTWLNRGRQQKPCVSTAYRLQATGTTCYSLIAHPCTYHTKTESAYTGSVLRTEYRYTTTARTKASPLVGCSTTASWELTWLGYPATLRVRLAPDALRLQALSACLQGLHCAA
jgi:hypothetical protein